MSFNEEVTFTTTITNIDSTARIIYNGLSGGTNLETSEELRQRVLKIIQEPQAPLNVNNIKILLIEAIPTITNTNRIKVYENTPANGSVTVYFVEDSKSNILPDTATQSLAKNTIISIKDAFVKDDEIIVNAPTLNPQNFTFSSLNPNTSTMRSTIKANIEDYFNNLNIGDKIVKNDYLAFISNSQDSSTGATLQSFNLSL